MNVFPVIQKTRRILSHTFMSTASNTQLMFTHIHFVDLLSCPLESVPESPSDEGAKLFGAAEVLTMADL